MRDYIKEYNEIANIYEMNMGKTVNIICITTYHHHVLEIHMPEILEILKNRDLTDGDFKFWQQQLLIKTNESTCYIKFITPYDIKYGKLRGFDNYYFINLCIDPLEISDNDVILS